MSDLFDLPKDLPVPEDDGACDHLPGKDLPGLALLSTAGRKVRLDEQAQSRTVFFFYPRTGRPGVPIPREWDQIPARAAARRIPAPTATSTRTSRG
jgi:hypothetical protein